MRRAPALHTPYRRHKKSPEGRIVTGVAPTPPRSDPALRPHQNAGRQDRTRIVINALARNTNETPPLPKETLRMPAPEFRRPRKDSRPQ